MHKGSKVNLKQFAQVLIVFIAVGATATTHSFAEDFQGPRAYALGGAGHAGPFLNDAVYQNPAYLGFSRAYSIAANGLLYKKAANEHYRGSIFNASAVDATSPLVQAGMGYTQRDDLQMGHLAIAKSLFERTSFGLTGKAFAPRGAAIKDAKFDGMASIAYVYSETIQVSATADNIHQSTAQKARGMYRQYTLGTKLNIQKMLLIYLDPHYTPDLPSGSLYGHQVGVEIPTFADLFLRGGMFKSSFIPTQATYGKGWGMGFGWIGPRLSLDYAFSRVQEPARERIHTAGVSVFF